jgi:hypothetical protein
MRKFTQDAEKSVRSAEASLPFARSARPPDRRQVARPSLFGQVS